MERHSAAVSGLNDDHERRIRDPMSVAAAEESNILNVDDFSVHLDGGSAQLPAQVAQAQPIPSPPVADSDAGVVAKEMILLLDEVSSRDQPPLGISQTRISYAAVETTGVESGQALEVAAAIAVSIPDSAPTATAVPAPTAQESSTTAEFAAASVLRMLGINVAADGTGPSRTPSPPSAFQHSSATLLPGPSADPQSHGRHSSPSSAEQARPVGRPRTLTPVTTTPNLRTIAPVQSTPEMAKRTRQFLDRTRSGRSYLAALARRPMPSSVLVPSTASHSWRRMTIGLAWSAKSKETAPGPAGASRPQSSRSIASSDESQKSPVEKLPLSCAGADERGRQLRVAAANYAARSVLQTTVGLRPQGVHRTPTTTKPTIAPPSRNQFAGLTGCGDGRSGIGGVKSVERGQSKVKVDVVRQQLGARDARSNGLLPGLRMVDPLAEPAQSSVDARSPRRLPHRSPKVMARASAGKPQAPQAHDIPSKMQTSDLTPGREYHPDAARSMIGQALVTSHRDVAVSGAPAVLYNTHWPLATVFGPAPRPMLLSPSDRADGYDATRPVNTVTVAPGLDRSSEHPPTAKDSETGMFAVAWSPDTGHSSYGWRPPSAPPIMAHYVANPGWTGGKPQLEISSTTREPAASDQQPPQPQPVITTNEEPVLFRPIARRWTAGTGCWILSPAMIPPPSWPALGITETILPRLTHASGATSWPGSQPTSHQPYAAL